MTKTLKPPKKMKTPEWACHPGVEWYPSGKVQVNFQGTKTSLPVVWREGILAKSAIKSEGVSIEMTN